MKILSFLLKEQNVPFRDRAPNLIGDGPAATVQNVSVPLPNTFVKTNFDNSLSNSIDSLSFFLSAMIDEIQMIVMIKLMKK